MLNKIKYGLTGYAGGFFSAVILVVIFRGCLIPEEPVKKTGTVRKREVITKSEYKPGRPDTVEVDAIYRSSVKSKKGDEGFQDTIDSSVVKKHFEYENANLDIIITTYPAIDSLKAVADLKQTAKEISRVDTVYKETTITDSVITETTIEIKSIPAWQLKAGISSAVESKFTVLKHLQLSYSFPVWFFYLTAEAGFQNEFSNGLKDLQLLTKAEINIPF